MSIFQFDGGWIGSILWFLLFFIMIFFYPKLMVNQMIWKLQMTVNLLSGLTSDAKKIVLRKISKNPTKETRNAVNNFLEFFVIEPVGLDPYGIIKKIEHLTILSENRFKYFVKNVAPNLDSESRVNLMMGISGTMSLYQIEKLVRHFVELIKKTRNLQLGLILQMQLPLIERISKALLKGTESLTNGWPIGDSIGSLVSANLIGTTRVKEVEEDTLLARKKIRGKNVLIVKAKGPGGRLGKLGRTVEKLVKREKVAKIITIDAAAKLEGERTGSVAEGIGVAIGGIGVDRAYIENIATTQNIPLDSIVIKMSQEEAIMPMRQEVLNAVDRVVKLVEENVEKTKEKGKIIIVGVGNTCGIGNNRKAVKDVEELIKKNAKILKKKEEEEEKRRKSIIDWLGFGI